jgi:two-component system, OmpR family, sensor kinase
VTDRLTKNELTWLLAQEARTAAQKLRQGVGIGASGGEPAMPPPAIVVEDGGSGVESTLNQLDEAVSMLASLHGSHPMSRGRRGKIDVGALVWEVAPEARVQIEMGEGTTVFGDEAELRRMLHVLISQSGDPLLAPGTPAVTIRRERDEIRIGVTLGPETSATFETERGWLARMAVRYGGRLELDGAMQTLILGADVDTHRRELESLKKELAAAQAQGEAYARELASMWRGGEGTGSPLSAPPPSQSSAARPSRLPGNADGLGVLVAALRTLGADLRGILSAIGRDIAPLRDRPGEVSEIAASVGRHVTGASEVVSDLARIGACPVGELPRVADISEILREAHQSIQVRAARHEVKVKVHTGEGVEETVTPGALSVLLHVLIDHAINASPSGSQVVVTMVDEPNGVAFTFDDAGPPLPPSARGGVLSREFEALAFGRPRSLSLIAAYAISASLRYPIEIEDSPSGGARVRLTLPRL